LARLESRPGSGGVAPVDPDRFAAAITLRAAQPSVTIALFPDYGTQGWDLVHYSFHVERAGAYFRYDLDPEAARGMEHPLAHLHLDAETPRYPTGRQNLLELLSFLVEQNLV